MRIFLACVLAVVATCRAASFASVVLGDWENFKLEHGKRYESELEEKFRMKVFLDNKQKVANHNKRYLQGQVSFQLEVNKFADLLNHEFRDMMNGYDGSAASGVDSRRRVSGSTFIPPHGVTLPDSVDWRAEGAVTPVKDQGHCGACWAFSATGSLEGQHFRKTGVLKSLSEQNLMDCSSRYGNNACNGGIMEQAFQYVRDNKGIDTEDSYPYTAHNGTRCRYNPSNSGATDTGFVDVRRGHEGKLQQAVATVGPISIAIDASHKSFQLYSQGVYYEPECSSAELDHGVLLVGYGTDEESGEDFWLVKNSWGAKWGEQGYVKMARNRGNNCGIASQPSFPLV